MDFKSLIRTVPDFPIPGIQFRDITTMLKSPKGLNAAINKMSDFLQTVSFDSVIGPESRGFIFGVPLALNMEKGFIPARKAGKLPAQTVSKTYELEYGKNTIEIHRDAISPGQKLVIADDLLATGGTCKAICELVQEVGAEIVAIVFFIELSNLKGREELEKYCPVFSIVKYD